MLTPANKIAEVASAIMGAAAADVDDTDKVTPAFVVFHLLG